MVIKNRNFVYEYEEDPKEARSAEYQFVRYFNLLMIFTYLFSSIWIFFFIFEQAEWEKNRWSWDAVRYVGVDTWKWWIVVVVIAANIITVPLMYLAVWQDKSPYMLLVLAGLAYCYSLFGIISVYLRGSIVCFVFPFVVATLSIIQFFMQRHEDEEFKLTQGLRLREREPTMEQFLRD